MSRKLIVADESIIIQKTIELILAEKDLVIDVFSNGEEALTAIKAEPPDMVFANTELPEINGYELCSAIKKEPSLKTVPVILFVPAVEGIDEMRAKEAGVDDYIIKPFEPEALLSKIDTAVSLKDVIAQLKRELERARKQSDKTSKKLSKKADALKSSENIITQLKDELQETKEQIDKINKKLLSREEAVKTSENTITQLKSELQQAEKRTDELNKELTEKILFQAIPQITDRIIDNIIKGPLMNELKSSIEKAVEGKIPYIVERIITEEIEKIKGN